MIVGIVDRRPLLVAGIRAALEREKNITVQESTRSDSIRSHAIWSDGLDVLVLDGDLAGTEPELAELRNIAARTNILVLTSPEAGRDGRFLDAGAKGCIAVEASVPELVAAVRAAGDRGRQSDTRPGTGLETLSPRERDVLSHIAHGFTHEQTATRLKISRHTVDTYIKRARSKLRLGNKADLTRAVLGAGPTAGGAAPSVTERHTTTVCGT